MTEEAYEEVIFCLDKDYVENVKKYRWNVGLNRNQSSNLTIEKMQRVMDAPVAFN